MVGETPKVNGFELLPPESTKPPPEATVTGLVVLPSAEGLAKIKAPEFTAVVPLYVLAPLNVTVPPAASLTTIEPTVSDPPSTIGPLTVVPPRPMNDNVCAEPPVPIETFPLNVNAPPAVVAMVASAGRLIGPP